MFRGCGTRAGLPQPVWKARILPGGAHGRDERASTRRRTLPRAAFPATTVFRRPGPALPAGQLPGATPDEADELVLMLSELATNAVQHAATEFEVAVLRGADGRPRARRGQRRRRRVPDTAGAGPRRAARARPAHRARPGRRLGHRDAARPARQDRVVHDAAVRRRTGAAGGAGAGRADAGRVDASAGATAEAAWRRRPRRPRPRPAAKRLAGDAGDRRQPAWPVKGVRTVLDGLRDAVVVTDEQGVIRYVNTAADELLGWPEGSLVGRSGLRPRARVAAAAMGRGLRRVRPLAGSRPGGAPARRRHQAGGRHRRRHGVGHQRLRPPARRPGRRRHPPPTRRAEAPALVRADERAARDPRRRPDRRPAGRAAALHPRPAAGLGRDDAVGALGRPRAGLPARVDAHARASRPPSRRRRRRIPTSGSEGLPRWVMDHGEPLWVPDLASDQRFVDGRAAARTACRAPTPSRSGTTAPASGSSRC